jgi:hypothetical protein
MLALLLTITLDSQELKFPTRQLDEFIQVMEFMSHKSPPVDHEDMAVARRLKDKLNPVEANADATSSRRAKQRGAYSSGVVLPHEESRRYGRVRASQPLFCSGVSLAKAKCVRERA